MSFRFCTRDVCCMLVITVLIILCILTPINEPYEGFGSGYGYRHCGSCGFNSTYRCASCVNCGYCVTSSGYGHCVPGDERGPYFASDCYDWFYRSMPNILRHHIFPVILWA